MAEVVLFHSVLGLRPGVITAADRLSAAGHTIHTPDYYDGEVFDNLEEGMRKEDALGYQEIARRARESVGWLPEGLVFAGFSLGAVHAEVLAASRPGALGVVLLHGAESVETLSEFFGVEHWPAGIPVQVHYATGDPWVEAEGEVAPSGTQLEGPVPPSRCTPTPAPATSLPTLTCPTTIARRPRRCGGGCSPSWIGSTPEGWTPKEEPTSRPRRRPSWVLCPKGLSRRGTVLLQLLRVGRKTLPQRRMNRVGCSVQMEGRHSPTASGRGRRMMTYGRRPGQPGHPGTPTPDLPAASARWVAS